MAAQPNSSLLRIRNVTLTVLALGGSALFQLADADVVPFPQDGDVFMGFRSSTATNEYLWDLGQYTQFDGQPVGTHLLLAPNIQADLITVFGPNWATDINVQWGSAGTLDSASRLFASEAEPGVGNFALPWPRQSTSSQNVTGSNIDTLVFGGFAGQNASPNNPNAVIHSATAGLTWASFNNGSNSPGGSFGTWVPTVEAPQTPGSGSGIVATRLDLFRIDPDNTGTNPPSTYMGSLSIDTLGNVSFDVFDTSPRPIVTTGVATDITKTSATLNGTVNPNGSDTTYQFEYGTSTSYGNTTTATDVGGGTNALPASAGVSGLTAGTTYHFRITATNAIGTSTGADAIFTTTSQNPTPTPTPTASPTPTPTPTATPSPSPTPTPTPPLEGSLGNISTRLSVGTGDNVLIAGFIISPTTTTTGTPTPTPVPPKKVIIRALGPSLPVLGAMADPTLTLYDSTGTAIATNDDWRTNTNFQEIIDSTVPPPNDKEAALLLPLQPASYTAIVQGTGETTGVALVEVYDLDGDATSKLANISTRGFVQTGDDVMIAGVIVTGSSPANTMVRALGPTLPLAEALLDPTLEIYNGSGMLMFTNDNWKSDQQAAIEATGLAPDNDMESAILTDLVPGFYSAIVRGANGTTGNALVEVYRLNP